MKSALARDPHFALPLAIPLTMSRRGPTPNRAEVEHAKAVAINPSFARDVDAPVSFSWKGSGGLVELPLRREDGAGLASLLATEPFAIVIVPSCLLVPCVQYLMFMFIPITPASTRA